MAKDPAFLFYYQDFIVGTTFLSNAETGAYIRVLCHLADKGEITDVQIAMICDKDTEMAMVVISKLKCISEGVYYSPRLAIEVEKRRAFAESRRKNRTKKNKKHINKTSKTYEPHMENVNEDVNLSSSKKKKCLFKNSQITIKDIEEAFKKTTDIRLADAEYYFNAVLDWSDSKNEMRADWVATARSFARKDTKDGKLKIRKVKPPIYKPEKDIPRESTGKPLHEIIGKLKIGQDE